MMLWLAFAGLNGKCRAMLFNVMALSENCPTFLWNANMLRINSVLGLTLLLCAPLAFAANDDSTPCDNVDNDVQSYACAAYNKQTAERELQAAFDDLIQRIRDQYPDEGDKVQSLSERFRAAQTLWTQLRDADCKVETAAEKPGSKAFEAAWNTCVAQRSDDRSEYLQSIGQQ